jgi:hypothetical protein
MAPVPAAAVDRGVRHARAAVFAVFFVNAVLYANLVPRLPEVKDRLDLSNAALGSAIAAMPVGALLAGLLAPALIQRLGSATVASSGLVVLGVAVAGVPLSGAWAVFAALMLVVGAVDAVVDVAQNAHGFRVQRAYGCSIVNASTGCGASGRSSAGSSGRRRPGWPCPWACTWARRPPSSASPRWSPTGSCSAGRRTPSGSPPATGTTPPRPPRPPRTTDARAGPREPAS